MTEEERVLRRVEEVFAALRRFDRALAGANIATRRSAEAFREFREEFERASVAIRAYYQRDREWRALGAAVSAFALFVLVAGIVR